MQKNYKIQMFLTLNVVEMAAIVISYAGPKQSEEHNTIKPICPLWQSTVYNLMMPLLVTFRIVKHGSRCTNKYNIRLGTEICWIKHLTRGPNVVKF